MAFVHLFPPYQHHVIVIRILPQLIVQPCRLLIDVSLYEEDVVFWEFIEKLVLFRRRAIRYADKIASRLKQ